MEEADRVLAEKYRIYLKILSRAMILGVPVTIPLIFVVGPAARMRLILVLLAGITACLADRILFGLERLPQATRFALTRLIDLLGATAALYLAGHLAYPLVALYALGVMVDASAGKTRHIVFMAALSHALFSLVILAWNAWQFNPAYYIPAVAMTIVMGLALTLGLLSAKAGRDLRQRLTESVANLQAVRAEKEDQLRKTTEANVRLEERYAETYALFLIEQGIAAELEVEKTLPRVTEILLGLLGGRSCSIMLVDEERAYLRQAAVSGVNAGTLVFPCAGNPYAKACAENIPLTQTDLTAQEWAFWAARGTAGLLGVPLGTKAGQAGLILVEYDRLPQSLADHRDLLSLVAGQLSLALENAHLYRRLRLMATHDALTGLYNRHYFQERLDAEMEAAGEGRPLSAILLDVDRFKRVNDEFGHQVGDEVLRALAGRLGKAVGQGATLARYGGEEFIVLLPGVDLFGAVRVAEAVRTIVKEAPLHWSGGSIRLTVSLGVASYPSYADSQRALLRLADQALYLAKQQRDKVVAATEMPGEPRP